MYGGSDEWDEGGMEGWRKGRGERRDSALSFEVCEGRDVVIVVRWREGRGEKGSVSLFGGNQEGVVRDVEGSRRGRGEAEGSVLSY